mmetsp:Transcript_41108/g.57818  ORF Transcript_41108/g.57818 Transcript_41108/m.57818 type:complete len:489 (-) Transcript_41108:71-1537(-)|eukprot:CAMPEP_0202452680 /NCGR_PEP_ID=MMETSP1360-20130828/10828_1 /ASSEMBLY_ACC=CAM_ASM_000848 /TAXON_ID=515479 /ORGANISM="Licmophora paradoxa, Strain CCMP2313" /LENGTH=488 /DNA_ID=CAMNT_0049071563 /DNA_START=63 /DNA_END=1529 /DNA_ORIENTATION=+
MIRTRYQAFSRKDSTSTAVSVRVSALLFAMGVLATLPSTSALAPVKQTAKLSTLNNVVLPFKHTEAVPTIADKNCMSWTDELLSGYEDEVDEFLSLQKSVGSEVLDSELMKQINEASLSPNTFLDLHVEDASLIERIAMASIPQQLPKPAVEALSSPAKQTVKKSNGKKKRTGLNEPSTRLSVEEELKLARTVQQGVMLHNIKTKFESKNGREITRQEWVKLAELKSTKELRRKVSDYRTAKQALVAANIGLIHAVVRAFPRKTVSYEELIQEGSLGLLRAAELFDPERGLRFSTYATIWIKGVLSNSKVEEPIALPAREKTKWNKIRQAHTDLGAALDREPTSEEIANSLGLTTEEVIVLSRKMSNVKRVLSLDYEYNSQSKGGAASGNFNGLQLDKAFMVDVDLAERTQFRADLVATLTKNLNPREGRLMRLRYGLSDGRPRTMQECADAMGLSKTRVVQLSQGCLKKLREASDAESLQEYLLTIA